MNTPAHIAASLLTWRNQPGPWTAAAVTFGAVLPDATMFVFYGYQKAIGSTEADIWNTLYFQDHWQLTFDLFNSVPIFLAIAVVAYFLKWRLVMLVAASALLHCLCDLPLHNDDAHRHFLPFTDWRFASPVSYWDPNHYGLIFMWIELLFAIGACIYVVRTSRQPPMRYVAWFILGTYNLIIVALTIFLAVRYFAAGDGG